MRHRATAARGFTLVELLVAIALLSLVAVLGFRGLDGMLRTRDTLSTRSTQLDALQVALSQWTTDLDLLQTLPGHPSLDWNGQVLRILRRSPQGPEAGMQVVAWSSRIVEGAPHWLRWQSPPVTTRGDLVQTWEQAAQWAQSPLPALRLRETVIVPLAGWRLYYFREDAWTNPLSSDARQAPPANAGQGANIAATTDIPQGVRLELQLPDTAVLPGTLTRDWVRPTVSGGKS